MYKQRHIEEKLIFISKNFKIILLLGARQVGKSTVLKKVFSNYKHIVFDPVQDLYGARQDPDLFLNNFPSPIILDEVQFVPELLPALKRKVDQVDDMGQYILTGSQNLSILRNISESLAGRVGIIHLGGFTLYEYNEQLNGDWLHLYLGGNNSFISRLQMLQNNQSLYETLWRGNLPGLLNKDNEVVPTYLSSYIQTYIERDVRLIESIKDLGQFDRFLGICSALTAQEINTAHLGREINMNHLTARRWLDILKYCYIWNDTLPYSGNSIKRISKKRKGYIADTGLACYLQRISSPDALARHPLLGNLFESHCVNMLINLTHSFKIQPKFYHWRSNGGAEVDLILEQDNVVYPIEIKCKTTLSHYDIRGIDSFRNTYPHLKVGIGVILYVGDDVYKMKDNVVALPWNTALTPS